MSARATDSGGGIELPLARGLGAFSLALGIPQVLAPGRVSRLIGVRDDATSRIWMRAVGLREIAAGVGILSAPVPSTWVWARVAGDTVDLALLGAALRSRSDRPGRTLAAAGGVAVVFAADLIDSLRLGREEHTQQMEDKPMHVKAAVTVRRDRGELYESWRDFESFPRFMAHLEEVRSTGPNRSHWKARGPLGMSVEWDAEITDEVPGERIAWRSLEGATVENSGSVTFVPAPGDQGTEVHVELRYDAPGGAVGALIAKLFGEEPAIQTRDDLRRFKQIAETGEVARSDGAPEGQLSRRQLKPRPAHPLSHDELAAAGVGGAS